MSHHIYNLRFEQLDPAVVAKLWPFVNAYKPHDPIPTWRELQDEGLEKIDEDSLMDIIIDQYEAETECLTPGSSTL